MLRKTCRVCHQPLFEEPLLRYENMPKSAQFFPDEHEAKTEKGNDLEVCQCSGCGLIQLNNEPVHYYREVIRAAGISEEMTAFRRKEFSEWIEKYQLTGKRVLEVGCGQGEYLSILQQLNIKAYGIEFGEQTSQKCLEQGLDVKRVFIESEDQQLEAFLFDGFVMLNFLEHLPDPNTVLKGIAHNLEDDAIGLVEVPNFDMILRENMFSEFISDHLFYFTKETFTSTLARSGFEVLECSETWHDYSLSAVVKKRAKTDLSFFQQHQQELKSALHQFIDQFPEKTVAIWGAGHQALAVMSLTALGDKIKYVVDSAPFKQNKLTPATHILIVSPEYLIIAPPKAVIVMAASYSTEVVSIMLQQFPNIQSVAVMEDNQLTIVK
jgi:2-polyprenyl-3-methyl-5-hydroxy-6-metoxy-1,4-benzoquinol methylase